MMAYHRFPMAEIVRAGGGPSFDTFFNFTHFHRPADGSSPRITASRGITVDVAFSLAVDVAIDAGTGLLDLCLQYDAGALDEGWVARLADRLRGLLAADPTAALAPVTGAPAGGSGTDESVWPARVAAIWADLLGVAPRGVDADFRGAGGDSLQALRFVSALRQRYDSDLTLAEFSELGSYGAVLDRVSAGG